GRRGSASSLRARRARACGCPSARRWGGSGRPSRPPRARRSPRRRPRRPPGAKATCGSPPAPSTGRPPPGPECSCDGKARAEDEAASVFRPCGHLAAVDLDALADADEAVAEAVARRGADAVVADLELQLVRPVANRHVGGARARVLERVRQAL